MIDHYKFFDWILDAFRSACPDKVCHMAARAFLEFYWALRGLSVVGAVWEEELVSEQVSMKQDGILQISIIDSIEGA